jgi:tyrosyl-tRNA synthetase
MSAFQKLRERGLLQDHTPELESWLNQEPRTFYVGWDCTATSLHAGSLALIMCMAHLQQAGHRPVVLMGTGTTMIGDPTGKDEMRKMLSPEVVARNKAALQSQLERYLDLSDGRGSDGKGSDGKGSDGKGSDDKGSDDRGSDSKGSDSKGSDSKGSDGKGSDGKGVIVDNGDWLLALNYLDFLRQVGRHVSVNQMLARTSVKLRLEKGLSFLEFNYALFQAYDFLHLSRNMGCLLQVGGADQWGNITAGVDLIRRVTGAEAQAMTIPLVTTADGRKMGKSARGAVWLDPNQTTPYEWYQYWINVDDRDVGKYLRIFTWLPLEEIERLESLSGADVRHAKRVLALEATRLCHGDAAAERAQAGARAAFGGGSAADEMPQVQIAAPVGIIDVLQASGLCSSRSDARRQIKGGAVKIDGAKVMEIAAMLTPKMFADDGAVVLSKGKKKKVRVVLA